MFFPLEQMLRQKGISMKIYMTEAALDHVVNRALRLEELDAPELIVRNERHIAEHAVVVAVDEEGFVHFPASADEEDAENFLDEGCGYRFIMNDESRVHEDALEGVLKLAGRLDDGTGFALLWNNVFFMVPRSALGCSLRDMGRLVYEGLDALRDQGKTLPLIALPQLDGRVCVQLGPVLAVTAMVGVETRAGFDAWLSDCRRNLENAGEMTCIELLAVPEEWMEDMEDTLFCREDWCEEPYPEEED